MSQSPEEMAITHIVTSRCHAVAEANVEGIVASVAENVVIFDAGCMPSSGDKSGKEESAGDFAAMGIVGYGFGGRCTGPQTLWR